LDDAATCDRVSGHGVAGERRLVHDQHVMPVVR
jgi:hypothetical protein